MSHFIPFNNSCHLRLKWGGEGIELILRESELYKKTNKKNEARVQLECTHLGQKFGQGGSREA